MELADPFPATEDDSVVPKTGRSDLDDSKRLVRCANLAKYRMQSFVSLARYKILSTLCDIAARYRVADRFENAALSEILARTNADIHTRLNVCYSFVR